MAACCYQDMLTMVETEKKHRRALLEAGVRVAEREAFELLPEDERQCAICKTTCFMSALTTINGKDDQEIVCLRHFSKMDVDPSTLILRYRYTLDELATLLQGLKVFLNYFFWEIFFIFFKKIFLKYIFLRYI